MKAIASAVFLAFFASGQQMPAQAVAPAAVPQAVAPAAVPLATAAAVAASTAAPTTAAPTPLPPLIPVDFGNFNCELNTCAGRTVNVIPSQGWSFECAGNCMGMTMNIDVGYDRLHPGQIVDYIDAIKFTKPGAGLGVTINIINTLHGMGRPVYLNDIRCEAIGACAGLTLNSYNGVEIMDVNFDCVRGGCMGAMVRNGVEMKAFDMNQNPNGQMLYPWQVPSSGQAAPLGVWPTSSAPLLPYYTPASPEAAYQTNAAGKITNPNAPWNPQFNPYQV